MVTCPQCQSTRIHRSRTRSPLERWRRRLSGKVPFRCSACGWRGWGTHEGAESFRPPASPGPPLPDSDAALIEHLVARRR